MDRDRIVEKQKQIHHHFHPWSTILHSLEPSNLAIHCTPWSLFLSSSFFSLVISLSFSLSSLKFSCHLSYSIVDFLLTQLTSPATLMGNWSSDGDSRDYFSSRKIRQWLFYQWQWWWDDDPKHRDDCQFLLEPRSFSNGYLT